MMKKITTLMMMLMGCAFSALAQTVASTSTPLESLQSGYYVLLMKTEDSRTDNNNGNFVYYGDDDLGIHYDETSAADHNLRSTMLTQDDFKYVFYVENNGGKISIKAYGTNYYWPAIPAAEKSDDKCDPANQLSFTVATSAASYEYNANGGWYYLMTPATKYISYWLFGTQWRQENVTAYVNVNEDTHKIGYGESDDKNRCQFQVYAVEDMPEPGQIATIIYNYSFGGQVRKTQSIGNARIGHAYPEVDITGLPDYITAETPTGTVSGDETIEIPLIEDFPFQTSTDANPIYYYLENVQGEGTRLYANSGLKFRTAEQATNVNDVHNDLWYVKGNAFDGLQFSSVGSGNLLHSAQVMSHVTSLSFSGAASNTSKWALRQTSTGFSVCPIAGSSYWYTGASVINFPQLTDSNNRDYSWKLNDDANGIGFKAYEAGNDAFSFRLVPATFTYTMYPIEADGNTYNTFAAPFDVTLADEESDVKMYKGTVDQAGKELVLSEVSAVPAGAGVMLMGKNSQAENVTLKAVAGAQALEGNDLVGITEAINGDILRDILILGVSNETGEVGFFSASTSVVSLSANHAYLNKTSTSGIKGVSMRLEGEATALGRIEADTNDKANGTLYDLTGRRVSHVEKGGLYIQNGRKFIAK